MAAVAGQDAGPRAERGAAVRGAAGQLQRAGVEVLTKIPPPIASGARLEAVLRNATKRPSVLIDASSLVAREPGCTPPAVMSAWTIAPVWRSRR